MRRRSKRDAATLTLRIAAPMSMLCAFAQPMEAAVPTVAAWFGLCCLMSWKARRP